MHATIPNDAIPAAAERAAREDAAYDRCHVGAEEKQAVAAPLPPKAVDLDSTDPSVAQALTEVLCFPDVLQDWISGDCLNVGPVPDAAERALRMPDRIERAEVPVVLAAAFLMAYRGDFQEAGRCLHELSLRYVGEQTSWLNERTRQLRGMPEGMVP